MPSTFQFIPADPPVSRARKDDLRYNPSSDIPDSVLSSNLFP